MISHPPLTRELGGAQLGMNLAEALRERGHDASAWSPAPLPPGTRWWNHWRRVRRATDKFAAAHGPFDIIDTTALTASPGLKRSGRRLVVRSIQPELLYLASTVRAEWQQRRIPSVPALCRIAFSPLLAALILRGWRRADLLFCLGSLELDWMRSRFPSWSSKLRSYVCCPSLHEREELGAVREARQSRALDTGVPARSPTRGTRFLWIGRWSPHKGTDTLRRFILERTVTQPLDSFTLAGCGSMPAAELPAELLAAGRVRVIPRFPRSELPALLAAHDAGLFTSTVEGWGLSLNEMLESGLPVFATLAGGVADLRPFFPRSLLPFPPPPTIPDDLGVELPSPDYFERFQWATVARDYEQAVS